LPSQPSINRGTLILLAPNAKDSNISTINPYFVFQYNPEKLFHTFNQAASSALAASSYADPQGAPYEVFNLTFELDSTETDPSFQNQSSAGFGLHPALAMLELMMQPQIVGKQTSLPIVVFRWGAKRTVAVRFLSMNIEEKSFDITLNPTRANVSIVMRVLNASEINNNPGARNVCTSQENVRATLVDMYKLQTGQGNPMAASAASDQSSLSASAASASNVQSKTKISS
jgi:hypothetical protein